MLHIIADSIFLAAGSSNDGPSHIERPRRRSRFALLLGRALGRQQRNLG